MIKNVFTAKDLAARYGVSLPCVYKWCRLNQLPRPMRVPGRKLLRWRREAIVQWEGNGGAPGAEEIRAIADSFLRPLVAAAFRLRGRKDTEGFMAAYLRSRKACRTPEDVAAFASIQIPSLLGPVCQQPQQLESLVTPEASLVAVAVLAAAFNRDSHYIAALGPAVTAAIACREEVPLDYLRGFQARIRSELVEKQTPLPSFWCSESQLLFGTMGKGRIDDPALRRAVDEVFSAVETAL